MACKCFLPFYRLPFHSVDGFLCCTEGFSLVESRLSVFAFVAIAMAYHHHSQYHDAFPLFSSSSLTVSGIMFKSLIFLELLFLWYEIRVILHVYPIFPSPFVEEIVLSLLCVLGSFINDDLTVYAWRYFWALCCFVGQHMSLYHYVVF